MINTKGRGFYRLSFTTLIAVFVLILAGGVVRSTGSGMGCPDWPKCFGQWIPPTSVGQLPENYKEVYADFRHKKNIKFVRYLRIVGMDKTADNILTDETILEEADFNAVKTWTEYINRLIGVIVGFLILLMAFFSLPFRKNYSRITYVSLITLLAVIFQGWIGSIVVSTNLLPWLITIHMVLALVIVLLLVYLYNASKNYVDGVGNNNSLSSNTIIYLLAAGMFVLLIQIVLGTQVREEVDIISASMGEAQRSFWVDNLGIYFLIHRSFSWLVLIISGLIVWKLYRIRIEKQLAFSFLMVILGLFIGGVVMAYFGIPAYLQPVHLLLAALAFGLQFLLLLRLNKSLRSEVR